MAILCQFSIKVPTHHYHTTKKTDDNERKGKKHILDHPRGILSRLVPLAHPILSMSQDEKIGAIKVSNDLEN